MFDPKKDDLYNQEMSEYDTDIDGDPKWWNDIDSEMWDDVDD